MHFILPREIGKVEITSDVPEEIVRSAVDEIRKLASELARRLGMEPVATIHASRDNRRDSAHSGGAEDRESAAAAVREMFTSIAPALRPAESRSLFQHRPPVVVAHRAPVSTRF